MLGHLMEWFYSGLGGVAADTGSTAFKHIIFRPEPIGDVKKAKVKFLSPYGTIANEWTKTDQSFVMNVIIPANTRSTIYLPAKAGSVITETGKNVKTNNNIRFIKFENGKAVLEVGAGKYSFTVNN